MKDFKLYSIFLLGSLCLGQEHDYQHKVDSLFNLGSEYIYTHQDSANFYFEKIIQSAFKKEDWETAMAVLEYKNFTAGYHYNLSLLKNNIDRIDSLLNAQPDFRNEHPIYQSDILLEKGNYYFKVKDFNTARFYFDKLLFTIQSKQGAFSQDDRENIIISNDFLSAMLVEEGKYNLALELYKHNLRFIENGNGANVLADKIATERLIGKVYVKQGKYELANRYFKKCVSYYLATNEKMYKNNLITTAFELVKNHHQLGKADSTQYYLQLAKQNLLAEDPFWPNYYRIEGDVVADTSFEKALLSYQKALKLFKDKPNRFETSEIVLTLQKIGELYETYDKSEDALSYYQKALQQVSIDFSSNNFNDNPDIESISDRALSLEIFKLKVRLLAKCEKYDAVLATIDSAIDLLDFLRTSFESNLDKHYLFENSHMIFETGLSAAYQLYSSTNNRDYLDVAFHYSEKSKSIMLLEAIYSSKAQQFSNVPDTLLEKEHQLKAQVTNLEKMLKDNPSKENEEQLFQTKNRYYKALNTLEDKYADYFNLKYNPEVISIYQLQQFLNKDEALITYFYGDVHLYSIKISSEITEFNQLNLDSTFNNKIITYSEALHSPDSDFEDFLSRSNQLHKLLINPSLAQNPYKKLYIIPDGLLNYIPFESLVTQKNPIIYLVENVSISYTNSATLLLQLQSQFKNIKLLSIAPSFENSNTKQLQPLPNNAEEARTLVTYFKGELLEKQQATLANFQKEYKDYGIFHFATHAILDDEFPEYSYLAFTPTTHTDNFLFISDLYNLKLEANLVSLSACETGIGDLKRGEGFISLSRAFYYSGAKSIVHTLWKINDNSSSAIMVDFYENLSKAMNKDEALRQAQLSFLKKHKEDKLSHPYYWSSFVVSGNVDSLLKENKRWVYVLIGALFLTSVIGVVFMSRGRRT